MDSGSISFLYNCSEGTNQALNTKVKASKGVDDAKLKDQAMKLEMLVDKIEMPEVLLDQPDRPERYVVHVKRNRERYEEKTPIFEKTKKNKKQKCDPINLTRSVIPFIRKTKENEENPAQTDSSQTEILEFSLLNYPEEVICLIAEQLDFKALAAFDQTCKSFRGIVDHTWGIFRRRDGLNFEFKIAEGKRNSEKYFLSYSVLEILTKPSTRISAASKHLAIKYRSISELLFINSYGAFGEGRGSFCPVYSDIIKLAAGTAYVGDSLLYAQLTPLKGHEDEILEHYTIAFNHGILAVSAIAWNRFSYSVSPYNPLSIEVPSRLENLVFSGVHQGDYATLTHLLHAKPSLIKLEEIQHYPPVIAAKAKEAYQAGNIEEAIHLYEVAIKKYSSAVPSDVLLSAAEACSGEPTTLKRAAELYDLVLTKWESRPLDLSTLPEYERAADINISMENHQRAAEIFMIIAQSRYGGFEIYRKAVVEYDTVIKEYKAQKELIPIEILQSAALANMNAQNFTEATNLYTLYMKRCRRQATPVPLEILEGMAKANLKTKKYKAASEVYEDIISRYSKGSISVPGALLVEAAESNFRWGMASKNMGVGLFKRAAELYNLAIDQGVFKNSSKSTLDSLLRAVKSNVKIGNFARAAEICELMFLKEDGSPSIATLEIAIKANKRIGNFQRAAQFYKVFLSKKKGEISKEVLKKAANINFKAGNFFDAANYYELAIRKYGLASLKVLIKSAESHFNNGNYAKSAQDYNAAVSLHLTNMSEKELETAVVVHFEANQLSRASELYELLIQKYLDKSLPVPSFILLYGFHLNLKINNFERVMQLFDFYLQACEMENIPIDANELINAANISYQEKSFQRAAMLFERLILIYEHNNIPIPDEILDKTYQANLNANHFQNAFQQLAGLID